MDTVDTAGSAPAIGTGPETLVFGSALGSSTFGGCGASLSSKPDSLELDRPEPGVLGEEADEVPNDVVQATMSTSRRMCTTACSSV